MHLLYHTHATATALHYRSVQNNGADPRLRPVEIATQLARADLVNLFREPDVTSPI